MSVTRHGENIRTLVNHNQDSCPKHVHGLCRNKSSFNPRPKRINRLDDGCNGDNVHGADNDGVVRGHLDPDAGSCKLLLFSESSKSSMNAKSIVGVRIDDVQDGTVVPNDLVSFGVHGSVGKWVGCVAGGSWNMFKISSGTF